MARAWTNNGDRWLAGCNRGLSCNSRRNHLLYYAQPGEIGRMARQCRRQEKTEGRPTDKGQRTITWARVISFSPTRLCKIIGLLRTGVVRGTTDSQALWGEGRKKYRQILTLPNCFHLVDTSPISRYIAASNSRKLTQQGVSHAQAQTLRSDFAGISAHAHYSDGDGARNA